MVDSDTLPGVWTAVFLAAFLSFASPGVEGKRFDAAGIPGTWQKEYLVDKSARYQDPRWELTLFFSKSGAFRYLSKSAIEIRLSNGNARSVVEEITIDGKWSIDGNERVVIQFDRPARGSEISNLRANLNYDPKLKRAAVNYEFDDGRLRLAGLEHGRQIVFRKAQGP